MRRIQAFIFVVLAACDGRRTLTEWQASDHQPPPAVTPEGQGQGEESAVGANERAAQTLWDTRCATCHGAGGRGDGPGRPNGMQPPDLTSPSFPGKYTDAQLHAIIKGGRNMMPAFGAELTDLGIDAMVKHVRTLSAPQ